jgi:hypothetical protein
MKKKLSISGCLRASAGLFFSFFVSSVRLVVHKLCSLRYLFYREGREEHEDNTILPAAGAGVARDCSIGKRADVVNAG